jgi:hypothetical protein
MRSKRWMLGAATTAAVLVAVPTGLASAGQRGPRPIPPVTVLFGQAVNKIRHTDHPTYKKAVVFEADGITEGGSCTPLGCSGGEGTTSAAGIVSWRFVFDNLPSRSQFKSAALVYGPKGFGKVNGVRFPFTEDDPLAKAPKLTLDDAVSLLQQAGHRDKFFTVVLRKPVAARKFHPLYIFTFSSSDHIAVDTVTRRVFPY